MVVVWRPKCEDEPQTFDTLSLLADKADSETGTPKAANVIVQCDNDGGGGPAGGALPAEARALEGGPICGHPSGSASGGHSPQGMPLPKWSFGNKPSWRATFRRLPQDVFDAGIQGWGRMTVWTFLSDR